MKKTIVSLAMAAFLICSQASIAQNRPQKMNQGQRTEQMAKELKLDEKQTKEFKAAMESMRPTRGQNQGAKPSRQEMEKKRAEMEKKIKGILTEEQFKKYQEMQKNSPRGGRRK